MAIFLSAPDERAVPAATPPPGVKEAVNLNSLIAAAVRQTEAAAGTVILRMDELPQIFASAHALQEAFRLLLRYMLAQLPASGKVYCYIKAGAIGPSLLDEREGSGTFCVEIHSNAVEPADDAAHQGLLQAAHLFAAAKIGFEHKKAPAGVMLFSLIFYGCAPPEQAGASQ